MAAVTWLLTLLATAVQATVPSTASPIAPPTCWPTLGRLAARPASRSLTLARATRVSGMNSMPSPAPATSVGPSSPPTYVLCSVTRDSQNMPPALIADPASSTGRAPIRVTSWALIPDAAMIMAASGISAQLVTRIGARPVLLAGSAISAGGMFWLSRVTEHSTYVGGLLGPTLVAGAGLGMLFMPLTLVALANVRERDAGLAASLPNVGQQVGGAIGLAVLGTVAWTAVASSVKSQVTAAMAAAAKAGHAVQAKPGGPVPAAIYHHALAVGFSRGFLV